MTYIGVRPRQHAWHSFTWNHGRFPENSLPLSLSFVRHFFLSSSFLFVVVLVVVSFRRPYAIRVSRHGALLCIYVHIRLFVEKFHRRVGSRLLTTRSFHARSVERRARGRCVYPAYTRVLIRSYTRTLCCGFPALPRGLCCLLLLVSLVSHVTPQRMEKPSSPITVTIFHTFLAISSPDRTNISKSIRAIRVKILQFVHGYVFVPLSRNRGFQTRNFLKLHRTVHAVRRDKQH